MQISLFDYKLDSSRIAQSPISPRDSSKLLIINKKTWEITDKKFFQIENYLSENDVLVLNETKVIKARLRGFVILKDWWEREVEIFLLKQISLNKWECSVFPGERLKVGKEVFFRDWQNKSQLIWNIKEITYAGRIIEFNLCWNEFYQEVDRIWLIPLPPYIESDNTNISQYNTIFAKTEWSAAAPTAGFHFTDELFEKLKKKWVIIEKVTLHIWLGTFKPITVENILDHQIHSETVFIDRQTSLRLNNYKKQGKRIIAVGTTTTRTLESFAQNYWELWFWEKDTKLFIYPWYEFRFVDSIITNFHLPKSSLLLMISAFYDREKILEIYEYAINNDYRFFSFGDAMWIV